MAEPPAEEVLNPEHAPFTTQPAEPPPAFRRGRTYVPTGKPKSASQQPKPSVRVRPSPGRRLPALDAEYVNPREQVAELVMKSKRQQNMPIPLDKLLNEERRVVFVPSKHPPDDPSGTVIFTKHGFFEIPKKKNEPPLPCWAQVSRRSHLCYLDIGRKLA